MILAYPSGSSIPSESTVESLNNHFILNNIHYKSWIICTTTNEEKVLSFDSGVVGMKAAFFQYKRIKKINTDGSLSFEINMVQHKNLLLNFPKSNTPYTFYVINLNRSNDSIQEDFGDIETTSHRDNVYFHQTLFIDIHNIPLVKNGQKSMTINISKYSIVSYKSSSNIAFLLGPDFIENFKKCTAGLLIKEGTAIMDEATGKGSLLMMSKEYLPK